MFFLFLFFTLFTLVTPQNTCSINALNPATSCVYCALADTVTIGANTTTSSPTQILNVGLYSATHNYGKQTPTPTPQTINAWTQSNFIKVGSQAPSTAPLQTVDIAQTSRIATLGYGSPTYKAEYVDVGQQVPSPAPSPTVYYQYCRLCTYSDEARVGYNSPLITIGAEQSSSQSMTLGKTFPSGAPTLTTSSAINLRGRYHYVYSSNCRPNSGPDWTKLVCLTGTSGAYFPGYVTNAALSGSVTPSLPPSSTASPTATLSPTVSRTVTSGYDVVFNEWHPPEPGYYLITFSAYFNAGGRGEIKIVINNVLKEGAIAWGPLTTGGTGSTSVIAQFDATGTGYYIYVNGHTMYSDSNADWSAYQARLNIVRVA